MLPKALRPAGVAVGGVVVFGLWGVWRVFPGGGVGHVIEIKVADLVVDRAGVPHASLRIEEQLPHRDFRMRVGIFDDLAGLGVQAVERVLLVRGIKTVLMT